MQRREEKEKKSYPRYIDEDGKVFQSMVLPKKKQREMTNAVQPQKGNQGRNQEAGSQQGNKKRRNKGGGDNGGNRGNQPANQNQNQNRRNEEQKREEPTSRYVEKREEPKSGYVEKNTIRYVQKSDTCSQVTSSQIGMSARWEDNSDDEIVNGGDMDLVDQDFIEQKFRQLFMPFDDESVSSSKPRRIPLAQQYGQLSERLIKRALKRYFHKADIKRINDIYLLVDPHYPYIELQCTTNRGKEQNIDLLKMFDSIDSADISDQLKNFSKLAFYTSYTEVDSKQLKKYLKPLEAKAKDLKILADLSMRRGQSVSNTLACYSTHQDQFNFLMVDRFWRQLRFNNIFLQLNKNIFSQSYKVCQKLQKKSLKQEEIKQGNAALVGQEEASSDQEEIIFEKPNMQVITRKLNELFQDDLKAFEDDIERKQEEQEAMMVSDASNSNQKLLKIMDEISELDTNLNNYKDKRKILEKQFNSLDRAHERNVEIYKELRMLKCQLGSKLPIIARKKQLFELLNSSNLIVLEGETGSGKSTQLPQMLCEYYKVFGNQKSKAILLTQPRKIATRTLAQRIASQLDEKVHGFVDYVSSTNKKPQKHSKIVLMLDRLLLDELQKDPLLSHYHCLVIDEAHERTLSIDILVGLIKQLLTKRSDFKVIITSATLDAALFERYFDVKTFKVSGRMFPVELIYKSYANETTITDKIKKVLNEEVLRPENRVKYQGHILVFCTTVDEINKLCNEYSNKPGIKPMPLHGKLSPEEQRLIFEPEQRLSKLIFSTRIAQTAVTIDKVTVVVDPGEDRQTVYDQRKKITAFELKPISKSAAKQRAGRAGRTAAGFCFRLYSNQYQQKQMTDNKNPEIKTVPLDTLVLRLKQLKIKDIINFHYLQSPQKEALKESQQRMQIMGCLDDFADITEIGLLLVKIPIEPFMSRALAQGIIIDMNNPRRKILPQLLKTLVMIVNGQSIFYSKYDDKDQRQELERLKFEQFSDKQGDFFSLLKVFQAFEEQYKNRRQHMWCKQKFLNKKTLGQAMQLYKEVNQIIESVKLNTDNCKLFEEEVMTKERKLRNNKDLILACILPSFCEELCLYSGNGKIGYTSIKREIPLQIYGTSFLSLQGINPKWIVSFDVFKTSNMFCRLAQAVRFDLLREAVPPRLFKRYKIDECQNANPFYQCIEERLPTVLFNCLRNLNDTNVNNQLQFLKESTLLFYYDLNKVELYVNKKKAIQTKKRFQGKLKEMSKSISDNYSKYTHHYLGSVTSIMSSGCESKHLNFSNYLYAVKIFNIEPNTQISLQAFYTNDVVKTEANGRGVVFYFENEVHRKVFKEWLDEFRKMYPKLFSKAQIKIEKGFEERKDKIAIVKLKVKFFIGQPRTKTNFLLMGYNLEEAELAMGLISHYDQQERGIIQSNLRLGKGEKPGITVFVRPRPEQMDEVDFQDYLTQIMNKNNVMGWKPPAVVKGFRQIDTQMALVSTDEWNEELRKLIEGVDEEDITIKGYGPKGMTSFTQIDAMIDMYDSLAAEQFKRQHDKKRGVIGNQKIHIKITYKHTIVKLSPYIYSIFERKFALKKAQMEAQFVNLKIQERRFTTKRGDHYVVIESSSNRKQELVRPVIVIKDVFKAEHVPLDPMEVKILNKKIGYKDNRPLYLSDKIFQELICEFNYTIEFQMLRKFTYVKVYSNSNNLKQVQDRLKQKIKQYEKMLIVVHYRGRNLHSVIKILEKYEATKQIQYAIVFSQKLVELIGGLQILALVQNQILKLVEQDKGDCPICDCIMQSPFCLFNCKHTYCKYCLVSSIRSINDDLSKYPLKCPDTQCKELINIQDLKSIFSQEEFDKMCDRGVQKQIDDKIYHGCATQDCEMIFQVKESKRKRNYMCDLCTMHYCYLCKDAYHSGMSCQEYKRSKDPQYAETMLRGTGAKYCKQCKAPIFKDGGCNHVSCRCGGHICWTCETVFDTSGKCYDHMAKCAGIFDAGYGQDDVQLLRMPPRRGRG